MQRFRDLLESIISSPKRLITSLVVLTLVLAIPITISLVNQRQDLRQRAAGTDIAKLCTPTSQGGMCNNPNPDPRCGQSAYTTCNACMQGLVWVYNCWGGVVSSGQFVNDSSCNTTTLCGNGTLPSPTPRPTGAFATPAPTAIHEWPTVTPPGGSTCLYGTCSPEGFKLGDSTSTSKYFVCQSGCYQPQTCPSGQTFNTTTKTCSGGTGGGGNVCPVPVSSVSISCSGTTVTCTWTDSNASSSLNSSLPYNTDIYRIEGNNSTTNCRAAYGGTANCIVNTSGTTKTLIQKNATSGTYNCMVAPQPANNTCDTPDAKTSTSCTIVACNNNNVCDISKGENATNCANDCKERNYCDTSGGQCSSSLICSASRGTDAEKRCCPTGTSFCTHTNSCISSGTACAPPQGSVCKQEFESCGTAGAPTGCGGNQCGLVCDCSNTANCVCRKPDDVIPPSPTTPPYFQGGYQQPTATKTPTPTNVNLPTATTKPTSKPTATIAPNETRLTTSVTLPGIGSNTSAGLNPNPQRPKRTATIEVLNASNQVIKTASGELNFNSTNSQYTGTISLGTDFTTGSYTVKVRLDNTLKKELAGIISITKGQTATAPSAQLVSGDINRDNILDLVDYNGILNCYGSKSCSTKNEADLNDDGKVDELDLNLLYAGFAKRNGD